MARFNQEDRDYNNSQGLIDGKKRHRRTATEINRHYRCPVEGCGKSYGSEGSLSQHIKNKHKDYTSGGTGKKQTSGTKYQGGNVMVGAQNQEYVSGSKSGGNLLPIN